MSTHSRTAPSRIQFAFAKLPRTSRKRPVYLSHEQVARLAAASCEFEGLVLLLAYTGLRWGEAIGLRVIDLDMLRKRASVASNAVQSGNKIHVGTPKSHKQRTVPLPQFLLPYLARQCEAKTRDALLWSADDGDHLRRPHPVSGWFAKAVAESAVPRVTPHDLRHTAASLAVSAGANVKAVQKMLGHAFGGDDARHLRRSLRRRPRSYCYSVGSGALQSHSGRRRLSAA